MLLPLVFYAKIIHYEGECYGAPCVRPQAGGVGNFKLSLFAKPLLQQLVGQDARLGESIHPLPNLHVNIAVLDFFMEVVSFSKLRGE